MFRTILVPLDGAPDAERALPYALAVARRSGGRIVVLHVTEPVEALLAHTGSGREGWTPGAEPLEAAQLYLDNVADRLRAAAPDVAVELAPRSGMVDETMLAALEDLDPDLIVLTTHHRPGVAWAGSVPRELVRHGCCPLLVVPVEVEEGVAPHLEHEPALGRVLVPLDGSPLSESIVPLVEELATMVGAEVTLMTVEVMQLTFGYPPVPEGGLLEPADSSARFAAYLARTASDLRERGLTVRTLVASGKDTADEILRRARLNNVALVAMATHGRGAMLRALMGSVADDVLRHATMPVLLLRPRDR